MTDLDEVTRLRPDVGDPTPDWLTVTRAALLEHADGAPAQRHRGSHRATLVALVAGIAVLAVIALVVPASSMLTASTKAQYVYVKQGFSDEKGGQIGVSEHWYAIDGSMSLPTHPVPSCTPPNVSVGDGHGGPRCAVQLKPGDGDQINITPSIIGWSYQQLQTLPTDATTLRGRLYDLAKQVVAGGPTPPQSSVNTIDTEVFALVSGTLGQARAPQPLVTAFSQVLPTIPGVTVDQNVTDAAGRPGVGFVREPENGKGYRSTLVFDHDSHRFLGVNDVDVSWTDYAPSTVIFSSGLVDHVGDRL
jgi:hypothetical protein